MPSLVVLAAGGVWWWLQSRGYETTDDAEIEGHLDTVSSRISGTVTWIDPNVEDSHVVKAGTLLMELDPRDYAADLEHAKAILDTRNAEARTARVTIPITDAAAFGQLAAAEAAKDQAAASVETEQADLEAARHRLAQDEAIYARTERDRVRYQSLVEKREISRSDYDARDTEATAAEQAIEADRANIAAKERKILETRALVAQREAEITPRARRPVR